MYTVCRIIKSGTIKISAHTLWETSVFTVRTDVRYKYEVSYIMCSRAYTITHDPTDVHKSACPAYKLLLVDIGIYYNI